MSSVVNPSTPYVGPVPGGLQKKSKITISGQPEHHHKGFTIALQAGPCTDPRSDVAFWFNPRFNENCVVRNTLQMGSWGSEERHGAMPFQKGIPVEITILVKKQHYKHTEASVLPSVFLFCYDRDPTEAMFAHVNYKKVSVNGKHFTDFTHRLQIERVSHIVIEQGLKVNYIRFEINQERDSPPPAQTKKTMFGIDMGSMFGGLLPGVKFSCSGMDASAFSNHKSSSAPVMDTSGPFATPSPDPHPTPSPGPYSQSTPGPYPTPSSGPYPTPGSTGPYQQPTPGPYPQPTPGPYPQPTPGPYPQTTPGPYPQSTPGPYPQSTPGPYPQSTPGPYPTPGSEPYPPPSSGPYQGPGSAYQNSGSGPYPGSLNGGPIFNPPVPCVQRITGGLSEGKVIFVSGTPNHGASRFNINLCSGSDFALHFDVRFKYGSDKNTVVTNDQRNGRWGIEKKERFDFPFAYNQYFDMSIRVEWDVFRVTVNGKELLWTFHKVKPLSSIDTMKIEGDVTLSQIRFQ